MIDKQFMHDAICMACYVQVTVFPVVEFAYRVIKIYRLQNYRHVRTSYASFFFFGFARSAKEVFRFELISRS